MAEADNVNNGITNDEYNSLVEEVFANFEAEESQENMEDPRAKLFQLFAEVDEIQEELKKSREDQANLINGLNALQQEVAQLKLNRKQLNQEQLDPEQINHDQQNYELRLMNRYKIMYNHFKIICEYCDKYGNQSAQSLITSATIACMYFLKLQQKDLQEVNILLTNNRL